LPRSLSFFSPALLFDPVRQITDKVNILLDSQLLAGWLAGLPGSPLFSVYPDRGKQKKDGN
jgi:hypothetical protein